MFARGLGQKPGEVESTLEPIAKVVGDLVTDVALLKQEKKKTCAEAKAAINKTSKTVEDLKEKTVSIIQAKKRVDEAISTIESMASEVACLVTDVASLKEAVKKHEEAESSAESTAEMVTNVAAELEKVKIEVKAFKDSFTQFSQDAAKAKVSGKKKEKVEKQNSSSNRKLKRS